MGFRGKYQTEASDSRALHASHSVFQPLTRTNGVCVCVYTVTQEVKGVPYTVTVRETMAKVQSFHGKNRGQLATSSPAVSACVIHNCSVAERGIRALSCSIFC